MGELTYKELTMIMLLRSYGKWLAGKKVAGILCGRTKEYAVAYIGVMKAGVRMFH